MKFVVMLCDGMSDEPLDELKGRTPLAVAKTSHMDTLARMSEIGMVHTIPKGKTIAVYCRAGRRSADAATRLGSKGYKVVTLYGGITAWKDNNMPVNTQQADSISIVYFTRNLSAEGLIQASFR